LLWGTDPRRLLYDLRRRLYARFPERHDWSSLTAYVSLPADFDSQLADVRIKRAMGSINAAMNHADEVTRRVFDRIRSKRSQAETPPSNTQEIKELLTSARDKITEAKKRLRRLLDCIPEKRSLIHGYLASTEKRQAEVLYSATKIPFFDPEALARDRTESFDLLRKSRDSYWDSFLLDRSSSWAVVQYISLTLMLPQGHVEQPRPERDLDALWSLAHLLSLYDLNGEEPTRRIWAHSNLIELYMLAQVMPENERSTHAETRRKALEHTDALIDIAGRDSFESYSTRRQIVRYLEWFNEISPTLALLTGLAEEIFNKFPEEIEDRWE
jgi:hypothetical protein